MLLTIGGICLKSPAKITLSLDKDATNAAAGNSLAARMESRQQDVETVAVSNATNTTNAQANENHESGVPPTGLDHD